MQFHSGKTFSGEKAWDAVDIAEIEGATVRLHWTDAPYKWHINDGAEVFVVIDGEVDMHYQDADGEHVMHMVAGDICHAANGDAHVAHPNGEARILVFEKKGSV